MHLRSSLVMACRTAASEELSTSWSSSGNTPNCRDISFLNLLPSSDKLDYNTIVSGFVRPGGTDYRAGGSGLQVFRLGRQAVVLEVDREEALVAVVVDLFVFVELQRALGQHRIEGNELSSLSYVRGQISQGGRYREYLVQLLPLPDVALEGSLGRGGLVVTHLSSVHRLQDVVQVLGALEANVLKRNHTPSCADTTQRAVKRGQATYTTPLHRRRLAKRASRKDDLLNITTEPRMDMDRMTRALPIL